MHDDPSSSPGFVPFMFLLLFAAAMFGVLVSDEVTEVAAYQLCHPEASNGR